MTNGQLLKVNFFMRKSSLAGVAVFAFNPKCDYITKDMYR